MLYEVITPSGVLPVQIYLSARSRNCEKPVNAEPSPKKLRAGRVTIPPVTNITSNQGEHTVANWAHFLKPSTATATTMAPTANATSTNSHKMIPIVFISGADTNNCSPRNNFV